MKFQYSAIGDNTPENREHLENVGWKEKYIQEDADTIVCASNTGMFSAIAKDTQDWFKEYQSKCIDCRNNDPLFQAVTALRDDSDKGWLINKVTGDWIYCHEDCITWMLGGGAELSHRKPTLSELQERFK